MSLDFAEICRLCGKSGELTYVFEEKDLWHKIYICAGVKIQREDEITQQICKSCYFLINTVYEFRLSSQKHDTDLKKAYLLARSKAPAEDVKENTPITYPSEETSISQESFLTTFNLKHKNHHSSVANLKRKFPWVNIPKEWYGLDIDPKVRIDLREYNNFVSKKLKTTETSYNSDVKEVSKPKNKKLPPRRKRRAPRQKGNTRGVKKILPKVREEENDHDESYYISSESNSMSINSTLEQDRNVLKNLLHTDAHLNDSSDNSSLSRPKQDFSNLLITVGEEVKTYICQTCNQVFDTQSALTIHKKFKHKQSLRCAKCSQSYNIVENLVKHNATCHPETVASTSQTNNKTNETQEEKSNETNEKSAHKSFARKRTGGIPLKPIVHDIESESKIEIEQKTDCDAYVISSDDDDDDDIQIVNVTDNSNNSTNDDMNSIINAVLEPQKMTESEKCIIENTVAKVSQTAVNDVLLITDSDEEKDNSNEKPNKPKSTSSTSQLQFAELNHVSDSDSLLSFDTSQKIVVVSSAEDEKHMDGSGNTDITNELNYINYIFSKCNFAAGNKKVYKKWLLKDIHKFTEKTIVPIEVIRSISDEVKAEYGHGSLEKLCSKGPFWNPSRAIGVDKLPSKPQESIITKDLLAPTKPNIPAVSNAPGVKHNPPLVSKVITTSVLAAIQSRTVPIESVAKVGPDINNPTFVTLQNRIVGHIVSGSSTNNVASSTAIQNNREKIYGRTYKPNSPKHVLPISPKPSSTENKNKSEQKQSQGSFLVPNGYILMGVSTDKDENQNGDSIGSSISNQPILLNGMPFSSLTNMRNPNPQMALQPQQTNVNIQNCINIYHQELSVNTQQQHASITVTGQNEQQKQIVQPIHQLIQPAQNQMIQPVVAPVQSDSNGSNGSRPTIRIKNLAELRGENTKPDQRNELHSMYTTALSNYVQTNTASQIS